MATQPLPPDDTEALVPVVVESVAMTNWTPRFAITVDDAVAQVEMKRQFMSRVMRHGEHYGAVPGTDKPTLLKPGAELLLSAMGLHPDCSIDATPPVVDLSGKDHGGEAFVSFHKVCEIYRYDPQGERRFVARASGNCNSWEKKYRFRVADRLCPKCGKAAIIKGKAEYGGGWVCFKKKDGCNAKFGDTDPQITSQGGGQVPNPEIADLTNTIEKMAEKRALVAAVLLATGCSDLFTQDLEDRDHGDHPAGAEGGAHRPPAGGPRVGVVARPSSVPEPPLPVARATNPIRITREAQAPEPNQAEAAALILEGEVVEVTPVVVDPNTALRNRALHTAEELYRLKLKTGDRKRLNAAAEEAVDAWAKREYSGKTFGDLNAQGLESLIDALEKSYKELGGKLPL